ncbi:MAG TPA: twin-arginine translocase subunit TatC [Bacilli bacterium]
MTFFEHLGELRKRIIWVLIVFSVVTIAGMAFADPVIRYLQKAAPIPDLQWNVFSPWDAVRIYMQFAFAIGIVVTLPFTLYQLWAFIKPGLRKVEQQATLRYIPAGILLFVIGFCFAYFVVFPMAMYFTRVMSTKLGLRETYGITQYFSFMFNIIFPISLLFEMPIIVMFLTRLRLLNPKRLGRLRRYAYLILLIVGAIITPPDLVSAVLVTIPLILLYEFSVWLSRIIYRKQLAEDLARERETDADEDAEPDAETDA